MRGGVLFPSWDCPGECMGGGVGLGVVLPVCPRFSSSDNRSEVSKGWCEDGAGVLPVLVEEVELM